MVEHSPKILASEEKATTKRNSLRERGNLTDFPPRTASLTIQYTDSCLEKRMLIFCFEEVTCENKFLQCQRRSAELVGIFLGTFPRSVFFLPLLGLRHVRCGHSRLGWMPVFWEKQERGSVTLGCAGFLMKNTSRLSSLLNKLHT